MANRSQRSDWGHFLTTLFMTMMFLSSLANAQIDGGDSVEDYDPTAEGIEEPIPPPLTLEESEELGQFSEPKVTEERAREILDLYSHLDPERKVPAKLLKEAVIYYNANMEKLKNTNYLTVVNFSTHSRRYRLFIVDMKKGGVIDLHVAHGSGSDRDNDGYAERFSNQNGSNASSLGFFRTAETYSGKHGYSLRIDGLSDTNSKARERAVVVHGAGYVREEPVKQGRSWGCFAVSMDNRKMVINMIKGGSLIYAGLALKD